MMSFPAVFEIMPEGFRHKRAAFTGQSVGELKAGLSRELRLPLEALGLVLAGAGAARGDDDIRAGAAALV